MDLWGLLKETQKEIAQTVLLAGKGFTKMFTAQCQHCGSEVTRKTHRPKGYSCFRCKRQRMIIYQDKYYHAKKEGRGLSVSKLMGNSFK